MYQLYGYAIDFSEALNMLKCGKVVTRAAWSGQGMFVCKGNRQGEFDLPVQLQNKIEGTDIFKFEEQDSRFFTVRYSDHLCIYGATGDVTPWVPSSNDLFAEDWYLTQAGVVLGSFNAG